MPLAHDHSPDGFKSRWLAEAVRVREQVDGELDDAEAVADARRHKGDAEARILKRARLLGRVDRLDDAVSSWPVRARWVLMALLLLAALSGFGTALAVVGDGARPVNVVWVLGGLLGVHLLSLLLWFAGFVMAGRDRSDAGGSAFGRGWLWLSARLSRFGAGRHVSAALVSLYRGGGLLRWWLGAATHGVWSVFLAGAVMGLLVAFSLRAYGFVWETTILPVAVFERFVSAAGTLPGWFGFSVPDAGLIRAAGAHELAAPRAGEVAQRVWASWLLGCVVVYGLLPRLLLWMGCLAWFQVGRSRVRLDLGQPGYANLLARLTPESERLGVTDAAPGRVETAHLGRSKVTGNEAVLVGIELRHDAAWPPRLGGSVRVAGVIDSREQRKQVLADLLAHPPGMLLIVCDPRLSPDRGSLALIAELASHAGRSRVWLRGGDAAADPERLTHWQDALVEAGFASEDVLLSAAVALGWIEGR